MMYGVIRAVAVFVQIVPEKMRPHCFAKAYNESRNVPGGILARQTNRCIVGS